MPDPNQMISFVGLALLVVGLGVGVAGGVRDADWWVITRGMVRGRFDRFRRRVKPRRG